MQFEQRLNKYQKKFAEKKWILNNFPYQKKYNSFIIVPAKAEKARLLAQRQKQIEMQRQAYSQDTPTNNAASQQPAAPAATQQQGYGQQYNYTQQGASQGQFRGFNLINI